MKRRKLKEQPIKRQGIVESFVEELNILINRPSRDKARLCLRYHEQVENTRLYLLAEYVGNDPVVCVAKEAEGGANQIIVAQL